jgi:glycerol-3-phosphate cytidylyltransferase
MKRKIIWYTGWVFDLFHIGHLNLIKFAKSQCDTLIVAATTDEYTFRIKGKYPIVSFDERAAILSSIRFVDQVISQDVWATEDFVEYLILLQKELQFDVIFKWIDMKWTPRWIRIEEEFSKIWVQVIFSDTIVTSSTRIKERIVYSYNNRVSPP